MEQKREVIANQLLANIETSVSDNDDIEAAINGFKQFVSALDVEVNYRSAQFVLEKAIREDKNKKQDTP